MLSIIRRKGLGTALLRKVVARGRELDVHRIYMYVRADNKVHINDELISYDKLISYKT